MVLQYYSDKQLWKPSPFFFRVLDLLWEKSVSDSVFHNYDPNFYLQNLLRFIPFSLHSSTGQDKKGNNQRKAESQLALVKLYPVY